MEKHNELIIKDRQNRDLNFQDAYQNSGLNGNTSKKCYKITKCFVHILQLIIKKLNEKKNSPTPLVET